MMDKIEDRNRNQKCFVNGSLSDSEFLTCEIPLGSLIAFPTLFARICMPTILT